MFYNIQIILMREICFCCYYLFCFSLIMPCLCLFTFGRIVGIVFFFVVEQKLPKVQDKYALYRGIWWYHQLGNISNLGTKLKRNICLLSHFFRYFLFFLSIFLLHCPTKVYFSCWGRYTMIALIIGYPNLRVRLFRSYLNVRGSL